MLLAGFSGSERCDGVWGTRCLVGINTYERQWEEAGLGRWETGWAMPA